MQAARGEVLSLRKKRTPVHEPVPSSFKEVSHKWSTEEVAADSATDSSEWSIDNLFDHHKSRNHAQEVFRKLIEDDSTDRKITEDTSAYTYNKEIPLSDRHMPHPSKEGEASSEDEASAQDESSPGVVSAEQELDGYEASDEDLLGPPPRR